MRNPRGFTLIELLIVVAVIGILATIAIPNLLNAVQRGKQKRSMTDLRAVGTACETYAIDHDVIVSQSPEGNLVTVSSSLEPTYMKTSPDRDAWDAYIRYEGSGREYTVTSYGRDRIAGGGGSVAANGATTDFDDDMVFSGGIFVQFPEGAQTH
jgi:type II secretion system protein G